MPGARAYAPALAQLVPSGSLPGSAGILTQRAFPGLRCWQSRSANWLRYSTELLRLVADTPGGMRVSFRIITALWQRDRTLRQQDLCIKGP